MAHQCPSKIRGTLTNLGSSTSVAVTADVTGYRSWTAVPFNATVYYVIDEAPLSSNWEIGKGTVSSNTGALPVTITRSAGNVLAGSLGAGNLVTFGVGTQVVYIAPIGEVRDLPHYSSPPAIPLEAGDSYYDTTLACARVYDGAAWHNLGVFGASGAGHSDGLVPDPGASAGTTRFLREDTTWAVPAGGGGGGTVIPSQNDLRLTLTGGTPVTTSDVTSSSTLYWTPYRGTHCSTYDSGTWTDHTTAEISLALSGLTSGRNYDVFAYFSGGVLKIDLGPTWNAGAVAGSDTQRGTGAGSTELQRQDGVWTNKNSITSTIHGDTIAANNGKYLGTIRATSTSATADSGGGTSNKVGGQRFLWNYYHRVRRTLSVLETDASWTYPTTSYRIANAASAPSNCVEIVVGLQEVELDLHLIVFALQSSATETGISVSIGEDSATVPASGVIGQKGIFSATGGDFYQNIHAKLRKYPAIGYHYYSWLELGGTNVTFYGNNANSAQMQDGMVGDIEG